MCTNRVGASLLLVTVILAAHLRAASDDIRLVEAVKNGDNTAVWTLLKQGTDVNATQGDGATALHWAAHWDNHETADLLIRAGATVNAANDLGVTPLWVASANGSAAMIARLLKAGADPNATPPTGETPLMKAARTGNSEALELLLAHHANVNAKERAGDQTALMWAVTQRHPEAVQILIDHGADVHARSKVWRQRVLTCCERFLGDAEGIIDINSGGFTPLLFAARLGEFDSGRLLLAGGADVNDTSPDGSTALGVAALSGHRTLAAFLLEYGADPNAGGAGYAPLHAAVLRGDLELLKILLSGGASPNVPLTKGTPTRRNEKGFGPDWAFDRAWRGGTPLWLAAQFAEVDMMRILTASGANLRVAANDGTTPLIVAAQGENVPSRRMIQVERERRAVDTLKVAIALGADINEATETGDTALHIAASRRLNIIVQFLAESGAALNAKNKNGQTPLAIALMKPEAPKGIAVIYGRPVDDGSTAELLRKLGATDR